MKHLVNKVMLEKVDFMGDTVDVKKLTVSDILEIQKTSEKLAKSKSPDEMALIREVIKRAVIGADEISNEEFETFPLSELTDLSNNIMRLSGLNSQGAVEGN